MKATYFEIRIEFDTDRRAHRFFNKGFDTDALIRLVNSAFGNGHELLHDLYCEGSCIVDLVTYPQEIVDTEGGYRRNIKLFVNFSKQALALFGKNATRTHVYAYSAYPLKENSTCLWYLTHNAEINAVLRSELPEVLQRNLARGYKDDPSRIILDYLMDHYSDHAGDIIDFRVVS